jgi:riboflavin biosynthesis pyrimidine reductase
LPARFGAFARGERLGIDPAAWVAASLRDLLSPDEAIGTSSRDAPGVVHTTSVWRDPEGALRVLRIQADTPRSVCDRFLLGAARSRAAVLLTSGSILRAEPELRHELHHEPAIDAALAAWRRGLGLLEPPALAVLSRGDVPLDHAALSEQRSVVLLTGGAGAKRLRGQLARSSQRDRDRVRVAEIEPLGVRAALTWLRHRYSSVTVELGPSAARELYVDPVAVDELWLGRFLAASIPAGVAGQALVDEAELARLLPLSCGNAEVVEASGRWCFERRGRDPSPTAKR